MKLSFELVQDDLIYYALDTCAMQAYSRTNGVSQVSNKDVNFSIMTECWNSVSAVDRNNSAYLIIFPSPR